MNNFWKGKRVLVTGGKGFVGSHLVKRLVELQAEKVFVLESTPSQEGVEQKTSPEDGLVMLYGDVSDNQFVEGIFQTNGFNFCFHLAAQPLVSLGGLSPLSTMEVNIMGTANILESARQHNLKGMVLASTTHVYGDNPVPFLEEYFPRPSSPYETSKACADMLAQMYTQYYNVPIAIGRFVNIYGPGDEKERIVPRTVKLILQNKNPEIFNDAVTRDYMYIDDAINGYILLAEKIPELTQDHGNIIYNFGSGTHYSSKTVIETIIRLMERPEIKPVYITGDRKQEVINQYVSIEKIQNTLGWKPQYSLEEGLKKTIGWWLEKEKNENESPKGAQG